MKVKFVGFGGYMGYPCYEDENSKLYFDENNGRNGLNLYTGAWRDKECGEICGEPYARVTESVDCDEPFVRHPREFDYMMLSRLKSDCDYFINCNGKCRNCSEMENTLAEMEKILNSFSKEDKPEWLTEADFEELKTKVRKLM